MGILKILKASAGSGKTHRLTQEYIRLILSSREAYRHVLAVTFTNKATEEMKSRILEELHKRSLTDNLVRERLISILHDYSSFNISTIDKFFQTTLRAFARESGINSSYGVELDDKMVIREAVDRVIDNLDDPANEELLQWFVEFSLKMVDEGKNWDIRKIIDNKINNFTKESYKSVRRDLFNNVNRFSLEDFIKDLDRITAGFERELLEIASGAEKILERNNLAFENFNGGSRTPFKYFIKLGEGKTDKYPDTFAALADNFEKWVTRVIAKTSPSMYHSIENAYSDGLNDLICRLVYSEDKWREYYSAVVVKEQIYMLGVLLEINEEINSYSREKNILLLSETNDLLNRIINGDDAPFIYEKVGSRTDHFLLDEFQDTSKLQWENFRPLIANSLSQGYENLLVGDVKQSIYRWRGSDWKILSEGVSGAFPGAGLRPEELQENWRSGDEIIRFNTEFFPFAAALCATLTENGDKLAGAVYNQSVQTPAKDKKVKAGHVSVQFVSSDESRKWSEKVFDYLPATIEKLLSNGFSYKDITFLVRQNKEGTAVAEWLIEKGYPVISEESLLLVLSPAVRKLISLLKFCNNPDDSINKTLLEFLKIEPEADDSLLHLPLYQMCETIISKYLSAESGTDSAYLLSFLDNVLEFSRSGAPDLNSFLEWLELKGDALALSSPAGQDAIRVMTIHKAKGLSIEAVILPFLELSLESKSGLEDHYMWCSTGIEPFNKIPYLPVKYTSKLEETIFSEDYARERGLDVVDNLNLAYVAFTRAKRELFIFAPEIRTKKDGQEKISSVANLLYIHLKERLSEDNFWETGEMLNRTGELTGNLTAIRESNLTFIASEPLREKLRLRYKYGELMDEKSRRNWGVILHNIMAEVEQMKDIERVVKSFVARGDLRQEDFEKVYTTLMAYLSGIQERHWFDGEFGVLNEVEIIEPGRMGSRPDRVLTQEGKTIIIDYKFGLNKESSHVRQMKRYLKLITEIRPGKTEGYLWYPHMDEILEVNL